MPFIDMGYIIWVLVPTLIISGLVQLYTRSAFGKWGKVRNSLNMTGEQVGQILVQRAPTLSQSSPNISIGGARGQGMPAITLERVGGELTDHYDPTSHTVRMSDTTASQPSVLAMAVVAHELGHAEQHAQHSPLILARNFLLPALQFSPMASYILIMIGLFLNFTGALWLGILFFGITVIFAILTLPVEFDASFRGLRLLRENNMLRTAEDGDGSRAVLMAAGATYVAAAITSVLQLLYYLNLARSR